MDQSSNNNNQSEDNNNNNNNNNENNNNENSDNEYENIILDGQKEGIEMNTIKSTQPTTQMEIVEPPMEILTPPYQSTKATTELQETYQHLQLQDDQNNVLTPSPSFSTTTSNSKPGMYVSARNLSLSIGSEKKHNLKNILSDLNFFLKPGSMVLMLGSPGCGKTALMKTLANQTHGERKSGSLTFNGKPANKKTHHRDVCYVVQEDLHMPSLTVKETFQFSADLQMNEKTTDQEKKQHIDYLLNMLKLEKQADTVVGNEFLRGISGGQKKRVTIGVELVKADAKLYLMDEISTGLDSNTTLEIIKNLKDTVRKDNISCLVSLLQPGSEITKLFDFLLILSAGHMVYFGPNSCAIPYFESFGFQLPLHHNPAEFFQEIVDEPELYYPTKKKDTLKPNQPNQEDDVPLRGTFEFSEAYKQSEIYQSILTELDMHQPNIDHSLYRDSSHLQEYPTSTGKQIWMATKRAFMMMKATPMVFYMRVVKAVVMGLILGSLYLNLSNHQTDGQNRSGLLFFSLCFIVFGGFSAIPILFESRDIFYIQRDGKYYKTIAFFLSQLITEFPIALIETIVFSVIMYWMCGLQRNAEKFIYFVLMLFATNLQTQAFFRMVSAFTPTPTVAAIVAPGIIAPLILFSGYMMAPNQIPDWWIYLYWISPIHYEFEGIMSNEHHGLKYTCSPGELLPPLQFPLLNATFEQGGFEGHQVCGLTEGDQFLKQLGMPQNNWFKWIDLAIVLAFFVLFAVLMYFFLERFHFDSKVRANLESADDKKRVNRLQKQQIQHQYKKNLSQSLLVHQSQIEQLQQRQQEGKPVDSTELEQLKQHQEQLNRSLRQTQSKIRIQVSRVPSFRAERIEVVGCYLQWRDLSYEVDTKKDGKKQRLRLLDNINGFVKPGMLLALMGPSGAGKSTLLDVLANRKTGGHTTGQILINGQPRNKYFPRMSAYVEQLDVLPPTQTVREAIQFSARTRLPAEMLDKAKMAFVENILDTLNLLKIANRVIGLGAGLSLSQRKRVNIGVELASDPQLLFLDEPTSGLDSSGALKVMNLIKRIADSGRSVICTIHQPSTSIFKQFDHLLLLKKGGETVYFGPTGENSKTVLNYFASHGLTCDPLKNPADFILEVTDEIINVPNNQGGMTEFHPVEEFARSELNNKLLEKVATSTSLIPVDIKPQEFKGEYSSTIGMQFSQLLRRAWLGQVRRVDNQRTRIGRSFILGVVFGTMFLRLPLDQDGIYNRTSLLFFSIMFGGMAGFGVIPIITMERGVFYRENSSGMYRVWIYLLTFVITDIPFIFLSAIAYIIPTYFLAGFTLVPRAEPFFYHTLVLFAVYLNFSMLCLFLACFFPSDEVAQSIAGVLLSLQSLFAGFMILPGSIPRGWKWFYHLDFVKYHLESLLINELKDLEFTCPDNNGAVPVLIGPGKVQWFCPHTKGSFELERLQMDVDNEYINLLIMFCYAIFFFIATYISLVFVRHQFVNRERGDSHELSLGRERGRSVEWI
ncbi:ABC transporter G family protein [Cavenderia fasciculata]|uniref:ABC transporter G family protein n=1 Tax=Cavenderia fasciculata TaxID=261658 RepID=F4Q080_CACFS|nr:ABC transporter G family protein [Cavenderia fasciculata]EGG18231.1 ABC transporter G family protein [Cavenderia fasciculata]|eukprot:XP_004357054.1 ABC transporter G family protein [Cavenderia fasciculata]